MKNKKLFVSLMMMALFALSIGVASGKTEAVSGDVVLDQNCVITDKVINGSVYIPCDSVVTFEGTISISGNLYIWGTLNNRSQLTVSDTCYCLHYGSMLSAGDYDYGYLNNYGNVKANKVVVQGDWIGTPIPGFSTPAPVEPKPTAIGESGSGSENLVLDESGIITDKVIDGDVYITYDNTITFEGTVSVSGNLYIWGTLNNRGQLTVSDTCYCLHYGSMSSAGDYSYGYFNNYAHADINKMVVNATWINTPIPGHPTVPPKTPTPTIKPTATLTPKPTAKPTPTMTIAPIESDGWSFADGKLIINKTCSMQDYSFGSAPWYKYHSAVTSITLEAGLTQIGKNAFYGFENIKSIRVPKSVKTIGTWAFMGCSSLETIIIEMGVKEINSFAFNDCTNLKSITIPEGLDCGFLSIFEDGTNVTGLINYRNASAVEYFKKYDVAYVLSCEDVHRKTEEIIENFTDATCIDDGSYDEVVRCVICNYGVERETTVIPATGHTLAIDKGFEETCTEKGLSDGTHCIVCKAVIDEQKEIPARGHDFIVDEPVKDMRVGDRFSLGITSLCGCDLKEAIEWRISNNDIIAIDDDGNNRFITVSSGVATLTAVLKDPIGNASSCITIVHSDEKMVLPSNLVTINEEAFANSGAKEIDIPASVTVIGKGAFNGSSAGIITIRGMDTDIEEGAFEDCDNLTLVCFAGSKAEQYAIENNIPFVCR